MKILKSESVQDYRTRTFRLMPGLRVRTELEAISFVQERGFIYFWPIQGVILPNLWTAVAGERPVADAHDDPGHITWTWKDQMLGSQHWYYAKILRKKATMISMHLAPFFYALSENYGSPEDDYLVLYERGLMTQEARIVYEAILDHGSVDTPALRRITHMSSRASESRFNRALAELQADFKILPVAVTQAGAWHYAFAYDIVARHYPDIPVKAQKISEKEARKEIVTHYFKSLGAAPIRDLQKLFAWKAADLNDVINEMVDDGFLTRDFRVVEQKDDWAALSELCD